VAERRRYTKRQKAEAVVEALGSSTLAASQKLGIPDSTLEYWMDHPEFANLREKTREQIAEGSMVLANLAQAELSRKVKAGEVEPRDLAVIYGIAIDKAQLLAGMATNRTESRTLTDGLPDHEKAALRDLLDAWAFEESAEADPGADPVGAGAEVRE
jgi:transposase-like protein